jgi:hypothetical protein
LAQSAVCVQAALTVLRSETSVSHANIVGLMTAEAEAMSGRLDGARETLSIHDGTLDHAHERAHAAYVGALVATIGGEEGPDAAAAAVNAAVQAQLDGLQVQTS